MRGSDPPSAYISSFSSSAFSIRPGEGTWFTRGADLVCILPCSWCAGVVTMTGVALQQSWIRFPAMGLRHGKRGFRSMESRQDGGFHVSKQPTGEDGGGRGGSGVLHPTSWKQGKDQSRQSVRWLKAAQKRRRRGRENAVSYRAVRRAARLKTREDHGGLQAKQV